MDVLATLQECSFRGVAFPVTTLDESFGHDTPQHKSMDRDGAFVENTGRNPFVFAVVAPFIARSLARGKNETWDDLYPRQFERFRTACLDRTTGEFAHPLYGTFKVKATDWRSALSADERGGQTVSVTFIETRDDADEPAFEASARTRATSVAVSLDAQLATLRPPPGTFTEVDAVDSFTAAVEEITRAVDGGALNAAQFLAKIDRTIAKLGRVANSIDRAASVVSVNALTGATTTLGTLGPGSARIWTNCRVLQATLYELRLRASASGNRTVSTYSTSARTTLVGLSIKLKSSTAELLALNPGLPRTRPTIPANTVVTYYARS